VLQHVKSVKGSAGNAQYIPGAGERPRRRTLPKATAFWSLAVLFLMLFFASAAASPLYQVYRSIFVSHRPR
jgi:hypothetical protein